jgi:aminoglycoside phosphotransferase (APT) family kinase protein
VDYNFVRGIMNQLITQALSRLHDNNFSLEPKSTLVDLPERVVFSASDRERLAVIVKVDTNSKRLTHESHALSACYNAGAPVPAVYYVDPTTPSILVMSYIEGTALSHDAPISLWKSAGQTLTKLHEVPAPAGLSTHHVFPGWEKYLGQLDETSPNGMRQIATALGKRRLDELGKSITIALAHATDLPPTFIHGDCQPNHFLCQDKEVNGIIDFGDTGVGDPCWDISVLSLYHEDKLGALLDGYNPSQAMRSRLDQLLTAYWYLRLIGEIAWCVARHYNVTQPMERLRQLEG